VSLTVRVHFLAYFVQYQTVQDRIISTSVSVPLLGSLVTTEDGADSWRCPCLLSVVVSSPTKLWTRLSRASDRLDGMNATSRPRAVPSVRSEVNRSTPPQQHSQACLSPRHIRLHLRDKLFAGEASKTQGDGLGVQFGVVAALS